MCPASRPNPHGLEMKIVTVFEEKAIELSSVFNFVTKLRNFRVNILMILNFSRRKYINFEVISGRNFVQGYELDNFIKFKIKKILELLVQFISYYTKNK